MLTSSAQSHQHHRGRETPLGHKHGKSSAAETEILSSKLDLLTYVALVKWEIL